jgi:hypothetical protein
MREPVKYTVAFVVVLALQYLSFGLHYVDIPSGGNVVVPLVIAGVMVVISALVFMELRRSMAATRIVGVVALLFVALLCFGVAGDVGFR